MIARAALRKAMGAGVCVWGAGKPYANIHTITGAIVSLYWDEVVTSP